MRELAHYQRDEWRLSYMGYPRPLPPTARTVVRENCWPDCPSLDRSRLRRAGLKRLRLVFHLVAVNCPVGGADESQMMMSCIR